MVKETINTPIEKKMIDIVNKKYKSQASNIKIDASMRNKSEKVKLLDKSRSTQITDTENTVNIVNKSRSIS